MSVYDLVFEMTGIDLMTTSKEDLHKETIDRSVSVMPVTPVEEEVSPVLNIHIFHVES